MGSNRAINGSTGPSVSDLQIGLTDVMDFDDHTYSSAMFQYEVGPSSSLDSRTCASLKPAADHSEPNQNTSKFSGLVPDHIVIPIKKEQFQTDRLIQAGPATSSVGVQTWKKYRTRGTCIHLGANPG